MWLDWTRGRFSDGSKTLNSRTGGGGPPRLQKHRGNNRPAERKRPDPLVATGPNQVWSWDITYLKSPVRGQFYYLYLFMDVWSRKIVGYRVETYESAEIAAELARDISVSEGIDAGQVSLHADNGGPMKGATMEKGSILTTDTLGSAPTGLLWGLETLLTAPLLALPARGRR